MSRLVTPATISEAPAGSVALLEGVKKQLGVAPNLYRLMAKSTPVLQGWLDLNGAINKGELSPSTRTRIAIAVAEVNGCSYCLSAHSYIGKNMQKLEQAELTANQIGTSTDAKADPAVRFAVKVAAQRGQVSDADIDQLHEAGYTDAAIIEIIIQVAANSFTNYLNNALKTEIDFPVVALKAR